MCRSVTCGDGVLEGSEQCDDGNTTNLDGCDSSCNFEQEQRTTSLVFSGSTDAFCTLNALGSSAITPTGLGAIQNGINGDVRNGITNLIFKFMGTSGQPPDLTGTTGPVTLGSLAGVPQDVDAGADGGGYNGNSDVDWWYTADPTMIDSARNPLSMLSGNYANKTLTTAAGKITIKMDLSGSPARLDLWNAKMQLPIGAATAPTISNGGLPPGHLASEHIRAGLVSFQTAGVGATAPTGELCGNVTAASLATVVCPPLIAVGGQAACDQGYTSSNSLLDVLVGGCSTQGLSVINATQPDQEDATVAFPTGTTKPYVLSASARALVDTCKDSSTTAKAIPLATCLAGLAYSSAFQFQSDRAIVK
jgi:cysteine-rich repeat protein